MYQFKQKNFLQFLQLQFLQCSLREQITGTPDVNNF